jgi:hypothetical protein
MLPPEGWRLEAELSSSASNEAKSRLVVDQAGRAGRLVWQDAEKRLMTDRQVDSQVLRSTRTLQRSVRVRGNDEQSGHLFSYLSPEQRAGRSSAAGDTHDDR